MPINGTSLSSPFQTFSQALQPCKDSKVITSLVLGTLLLVGGIFITLPAHVFPHGINAISQLGAGGLAIGIILGTLGLGSFVCASLIIRANHLNSKIKAEDTIPFVTSTEPQSHSVDLPNEKEVTRTRGIIHEFRIGLEEIKNSSSSTPIFVSLKLENSKPLVLEYRFLDTSSWPYTLHGVRGGRNTIIYLKNLVSLNFSSPLSIPNNAREINNQPSKPLTAQTKAVSNPYPIVEEFLQSIKHWDHILPIFIRIEQADQEPLILEYDSVNPHDELQGTRLDGVRKYLPLRDIKSISIVPKIKGLAFVLLQNVNEISIDKDGFIVIPEQFHTKCRIGSDKKLHFHMYDSNNKELIEIATDQINSCELTYKNRT